MSTGLWERRTEGERGGETVVSERWVAPTNIELEKGGAGEGGAVELWERTVGGLHFGLKLEPLSCNLRLRERQSVVLTWKIVGTSDASVLYRYIDKGKTVFPFYF